MGKVVVCGGGNAAHVLVALAANAGHEVDIYTSLPLEVERLRAGTQAGGGITARSGFDHYFGRPRCISANPEEVIPGSQLVLLALPAFAHGPTLNAIAAYLDPGTTVGALPARGGFDMQVMALLDLEARGLTLFGLQTLPWACRIRSYGQEVEILGTKAMVDVAVLPAGSPAIDQKLSFIPNVEFTTIGSFLALSLANSGQLIHPGIMYGLFHGREDELYPEGDPPLFYQGVDRTTAEVLEAMSQEIQAIVQTLAGVLPGFNRQEVASLHQWLLYSYPFSISDTSTLQASFVTNKAYVGLCAPVIPSDEPGMVTVDLRARYLAEDVPFGLVVAHGIAELAGTPMPVIDRVIEWAQDCLGRQYLVQGALCGQHLAETRAPQAYGISTLEQLIYPLRQNGKYTGEREQVHESN